MENQANVVLNEKLIKQIKGIFDDLAMEELKQYAHYLNLAYKE